MEKLVKGYQHFREKVFDGYKPLFERLAGEQHPRALFVTCSDSRVIPSLITQADPGELFLIRNAGNIVPPYGEQMGGVSATIEYAVMVLDVEDIIICGHSDCGAMRAVLHPEKTRDLPTVSRWLVHAESARRVVEQSYGEIPEEERLRVLIHENVLAQIDHLKTHPSVAAKLKRGKLRIHGWVYEIHTGAVEAYDVEGHCYVPLTPERIPSATPQARPYPPVQIPAAANSK